MVIKNELSVEEARANTKVLIAFLKKQPVELRTVLAKAKLTEAYLILGCWRRLKTDHPYRLKIDQGELLNSVLYSIGIVDQTELVLPPFLIEL